MRSAKSFKAAIVSSLQNPGCASSPSLMVSSRHLKKALVPAFAPLGMIEENLLRRVAITRFAKSVKPGASP